MTSLPRVTDQITSLSPGQDILSLAREPNTNRPIRITHIITNLHTGGAEMMLYKVLSQLNRDAFQTDVISMMSAGTLGEKISKLGVRVRLLNMRRGVPDLRALWRLVRLLKDDPPDLIQTWMYHANLMGGIAAKLAGNMPLVWGIHHSNFDPHKSKRRTVWTMKAGALLSGRLPDRIICCGETPKRVHIESGYDAKKTTVIPNGFDVARFHPDPMARLSVRQELRIPAHAPLIGLIARFHPKKDHRTFVAAAGLLHQARPDAHFVLCGEGVRGQNQELVGWIQQAGIGARCQLLGVREDMPRLMAALDVATSSSSYGEGFPIVLGEAMACGVPCVVTDVGDSALIVGLTGRVVTVQQPASLAEAWGELLSLSQEQRTRLGQEARYRIERNFSLPMIVRKYENLYKEVLVGANIFLDYQELRR
jgi:glycosyltransferase involved in cell wall biosynthesis